MASKIIIKIAAMALAIILLLPDISHALTANQKALVGLKGIGVLVEYMQPQAERLGLTRDQIRTDVELRLRKAGIKVLTEKEYSEVPGQPWLYVNINTAMGTLPGICAYSIKVDLEETVTLANGFKTRSAIWNIGYVGLIGIRKTNYIRNPLSDLIDEFINDYLAANPNK